MCDESLIDKVLEEGNILINIKGYADFYKGSLIPAREFGEISTKNMITANIVGQEAVSTAIRNKVIDQTHVKRVNGVPYAQAYKVNY